ncbi:MAG: hypothetical protein IKX44_01865 [Prevotella sp.]|nr:hypothetical protein [Prevotella sp.]
MKKKYIKPIVEVEKFLTEGVMQGHSYNMPTAKENNGWIGEDEDDDDFQNKNLWED